MEQTVCDKCKNVCGGEDVIEVKGFVGLSGGILLPERFHRKHFCNRRCFVQWLYEDANIRDIATEVGGPFD